MKRAGQLILMSAEDNLGKGASGQAVQNFNLCPWLRGNRGADGGVADTLPRYVSIAMSKASPTARTPIQAGPRRRHGAEGFPRGRDLVRHQEPEGRAPGSCAHCLRPACQLRRPASRRTGEGGAACVCRSSTPRPGPPRHHREQRQCQCLHRAAQGIRTRRRCAKAVAEQLGIKHAAGAGRLHRHHRHADADGAHRAAHR